MRVELRCPTCQGSGKKWIGSSDFIGCFHCHGTGRITEYFNTTQSGGSVSTSAIKIDTRTDEEKKIDNENAIAGFLSFCLAGLVVAPALMEGAVAWWIPTVIGIVFWIAMTKVLQGQLRIIPILIYKLIVLIGTLLAYTMILLCVSGFLYVVFKIILGAN
ncbi:MAG: hypothetical protein QM501_03455 [Gimesia sp.]